jgi:hypothetical protein
MYGVHMHYAAFQICKSNASFMLLSRFSCFYKSFVVVIFPFFCDSSAFAVLLKKKLVLRAFYFRGSFIAVKVILVS